LSRGSDRILDALELAGFLNVKLAWRDGFSRALRGWIATLALDLATRASVAARENE